MVYRLSTPLVLFFTGWVGFRNKENISIFFLSVILCLCVFSVTIHHSTVVYSFSIYYSHIYATFIISVFYNRVKFRSKSYDISKTIIYGCCFERNFSNWIKIIHNHLRKQKPICSSWWGQQNECFTLFKKNLRLTKCDDFSFDLNVSIRMKVLEACLKFIGENHLCIAMGHEFVYGKRIHKKWTPEWSVNKWKKSKKVSRIVISEFWWRLSEVWWFTFFTPRSFLFLPNLFSDFSRFYFHFCLVMMASEHRHTSVGPAQSNLVSFV